jgi:hypothetical protein
MSLEDQIKGLCDSGILCLIQQSWPGLPMKRWFYAFETVKTLLLGPWNTQKEADRAMELRAEIDWFIDGKTIYVRPDCEEGTKALLARLHPASDEVWEFRSIKPKPSLRVFGTFARKNIFIASNWEYRTYLGAEDSEEWAEAITQFKSIWQNSFPSLDPLHGSYPNDYLSHARFI